MGVDTIIARLDEISAELKRFSDPDREWSDEDEGAIAALEKEADELQVKLEKAEKRQALAEKASSLKARAENVEASMSRDVTGVIKAVSQPAQAKATRIDVRDDLTEIEKMGLFVWAKAAHVRYGVEPMKALEDEGFAVLADQGREARDMWRRQTKALTSIGSGSGDSMVFTPLSSDFIDVLRNASAFLAGNPVNIDMPMGSLDIASGTSGATASYTAEGADIPYSQMTTSKVQLTSKHLRGVTAVSNHLIEVSPLAVAQIAGNDLAMALAVAFDNAGLRGDGTGNNPAGIKSLVNSANSIAATTGTAPSIATVDSDTLSLELAIDGANVPRIRQRWVMANRVYLYLRNLRDSNGNIVYQGLQDAQPTWKGRPVIRSEQVPTNLGSGTNESELYLVDFGHALVGVTRSIRLEASTEAAYVQGGSTISGFSRDETVIRGTASHDFGLRYDKAAAVLTGVQWGA